MVLVTLGVAPSVVYYNTVLHPHYCFRPWTTWGQGLCFHNHSQTHSVWHHACHQAVLCLCWSIECTQPWGHRRQAMPRGKMAEYTRRVWPVGQGSEPEASQGTSPSAPFGKGGLLGSSWLELGKMAGSRAISHNRHWEKKAAKLSLLDKHCLFIIRNICGKKEHLLFQKVPRWWRTEKESLQICVLHYGFCGSWF